MKLIRCAAVLVLLSVSTLSYGQDRQFANTYQSLVLPKGVHDVEFWNTLRTGKKDFYNRLDQRLELEMGLTNRLQTAFYLNASHIAKDIGDTSVNIQSESEFSFSNEWKFKLSDPVANRIGAALYGEITASTRELEFETKIILDKRIDKHLFAFNLVNEFEYVWDSKKKGETELELEARPMEFDFGYMYNFKPNFGLGFEAKNHYEIVAEKGLEHSAIFAGPTLFWSVDRNFIIFNILPQIANLHKNDENPGSLDLAEYEKFQFRLLIGLNSK